MMGSLIFAAGEDIRIAIDLEIKDGSPRPDVEIGPLCRLLSGRTTLRGDEAPASRFVPVGAAGASMLFVIPASDAPGIGNYAFTAKAHAAGDVEDLGTGIISIVASR